MIDERTFELLSRYVDEDLSADEARDFELELGRNTELSEALDEVLQNRRGLRDSALRERPPEALDGVVRPLRRAGRPVHQRWVVAGFLAAAAVLVAAVILVEEVGRSNVLAPPPPSTGVGQEIFKLGNPPAAPPDAPIGAVETLMARQDQLPELPAPEPELGIGPVDRPPDTEEIVWVVVFGETRIDLPEGCPLPDGDVVVRVDQGRVAVCRVEGSNGGAAEPSCICEMLLALEHVDLAGGEHRGVVQGMPDEE
jgi:hypothetical protein